MLTRNQAIKKPNGVRPSGNGQKEIMLSQRQACISISFSYIIYSALFLSCHDFYFCSINQIMGPESWHSDIDVPVSVFLNIYISDSNDFSVCIFLSGTFLLLGRHSRSLI